MNRIYQGRVSRVQVLRPRDACGCKPAQHGSKPEHWTEMPDGEAALWAHHELFQDAVNYWFILFAALAESIPADEPLGQFRVKIREDLWHAYRGARAAWNAPFSRLGARIVGSPAAGFDEIVGDLLRKTQTQSSPDQRAAFVQALFAGNGGTRDEEREADAKDRFPMGVKLCAPMGTETNYTKAISAKTRLAAKESACRIANDANAVLNHKEPYNFKRQPNTSPWTHRKAIAELKERYAAVMKTHPALANCQREFETWLSKQPETFAPDGPGGKQDKAFNSALIFAHYPSKETRDAFLAGTTELRAETISVPAEDSFQAIRDADDRPCFPLFTELAMQNALGKKPGQLPFRDFEKAAFIEAFNKVNQYCRAERVRTSRLSELMAKRDAYESTGGSFKLDDDEVEVNREVPGFQDDNRIARLREVVESLADGERESYRIGKRTLKSFEDVKSAWASLPAGASDADLINTVRQLQGGRQNTFGAGELFEALAPQRYRCIWRDQGSASWHSKNVLNDWSHYTEVLEDIVDLSEPSNFTPAHEIHSPRYFRWSETNNKTHLPWDGNTAFMVECEYLAHTSDPAQKSAISKIRLHYHAPRLVRDGLRRVGEALDAKKPDLPWLHQLARARPELAAIAPKQTFHGTAVRLVPTKDCGCELVLEPELRVEFKSDTNSWQSRWRDWRKQFDERKNSNDWLKERLKWPKAPDAEKPHWMVRGSVSVLSLDLGLRHGAAYAVLRAIPQAEGDTIKNPAGALTPPEYFQQWHAHRKSCGIIRLSGEDTKVWRDPTNAERRKGEHAAKYRDELSGNRGRLADPSEIADADTLLQHLSCDTVTKPSLSKYFCEQTDVLAREAERARWALRQLYRWGWLIKQDRMPEVAEARKGLDDTTRLGRWTISLSPESDGQFFNALKSIAAEETAKFRLVVAALLNRAVRQRGFGWQWSTSSNGHWILAEARDPDRERLKMRGMRGLSLARIDQIQRVRQLAQSAAKLSKRIFGEAAERFTDEFIPDVAPRTLAMIEELREQRAKQMAHGILAQALGVRLAPPPADKAERSRLEDLHGVYEPIPNREPVDFIAIEDLSAFRTSEMRTRRANRQLSRWCKARTLELLRQMAEEPFGIPIVQVNPAYTSALCSRTGVFGFRTREIDLEDARSKLAYVEKARRADISHWKGVVDMLESAAAFGLKPRLLVPQPIGPLFIPLVETSGVLQSVDSVSSDINGATCIGLRALSHRDAHRAPLRHWVEAKPARNRSKGDGASAPPKSKGQWCLYDWSGKLGGKSATPAPTLPAFGSDIRNAIDRLAWSRCKELNEARLAKWRDGRGEKDVRY